MTRNRTDFIFQNSFQKVWAPVRDANVKKIDSVYTQSARVVNTADDCSG
jgi:hypothetical protein